MRTDRRCSTNLNSDRIGLTSPPDKSEANSAYNGRTSPKGSDTDDTCKPCVNTQVAEARFGQQ